MKIAVCDNIKQNAETFLKGKDIDFKIDLYYEIQKLYDSDISYDIAFLDIEMKPYSKHRYCKKA